MARHSPRRGRSGPPVEHGVVRKSWKQALRIALVYPNTYRVGMANLGFQTLYRLFNDMPDVLCERVFFPSPAEGPLRSVESAQPLERFDVIAFSISFENDFPGVPGALERAGLPLAAADRGFPHPLVVAGGVACWLNPEPIAPFIDAILLGEAEALLADLAEALKNGGDRREQLLRIARTVPGAYVPTFYRTDYGADGAISRFAPVTDVPPRITAPRSLDLSAHATRTAVLTDQASFDDTFLLEIGRGCPHGCRFCSAGYLYRPPRFRDADGLAEAIAEGARLTHRIGLVGAAVSDLPDLAALCRRPGHAGLRLSFSSLRADALTADLIAILRANHVKTATIAPDAGSERMRRVINKGITASQILDAAGNLVAGGIPNLKLYFMIGLPTETEDDITAIVDLCAGIRDRWLAASRPTGRIGTIQVSVNCFVPKPVTPFQWAAMAPRRILKARIAVLKKAVGPVPNMRIKVESLPLSVIQAVLSRGDRRLAPVLRRMAGGAKWPSAMAEEGLAPDFYAARERPVGEILPWQFIDHGLRTDFLRREYDRALSSKTSPPCPMHDCHRCGICMA